MALTFEQESEIRAMFAKASYGTRVRSIDEMNQSASDRYLNRKLVDAGNVLKSKTFNYNLKDSNVQQRLAENKNGKWVIEAKKVRRWVSVLGEQDYIAEMTRQLKESRTISLFVPADHGDIETLGGYDRDGYTFVDKNKRNLKKQNWVMFADAFIPQLFRAVEVKTVQEKSAIYSGKESTGKFTNEPKNVYLQGPWRAIKDDVIASVVTIFASGHVEASDRGIREIIDSLKKVSLKFSNVYFEFNSKELDDLGERLKETITSEVNYTRVDIHHININRVRNTIRSTLQRNGWIVGVENDVLEINFGVKGQVINSYLKQRFNPSTTREILSKLGYLDTSRESLARETELGLFKNVMEQYGGFVPLEGESVDEFVAGSGIRARTSMGNLNVWSQKS